MDSSESASSGRGYGIALFAICAVWLLLWTLLPCLLVENAYIDVLENIVWGSHFQFGYDKNPYFVPWLTWLGHSLTGGVWFSYVMSQVSVGVCLYCVWLLSRAVLPPAHAFLSTLFLLGTLFFGIKTPEFNDDVAEIALWALTALFAYKSLRGDGTRYWLLAGLAAGLSFMTKYYGVALFVPMGLAALLTSEGRASLKTPGPYLAFAVFLALSLPNMIWLANNDFVAFRYAMGRASLSEGFSSTLLAHLSEPFDFFKGLLSAVVASLIAFGVLFLKRDPALPQASRFDKIFISFACFGPFICTLLFSAVTGGSIKYSWMTPGVSLSGLCLVTLWRPLITSLRLKLFVVFVAVFGFVCSIVYASELLYKQPYAKKKCAYESFPGEEVAKDITALWHERYGVGIPYVIANREEACNFSVFSPDRPEAFFSANTDFSQWIELGDIVKRGAVVIWKGTQDNEPEWIKSLRSKSICADCRFTRSYCRAVKPWFRSAFAFAEPKREAISFCFVKPSGSLAAPPPPTP